MSPSLNSASQKGHRNGVRNVNRKGEMSAGLRADATMLCPMILREPETSGGPWRVLDVSGKGNHLIVGSATNPTQVAGAIPSLDFNQSLGQFLVALDDTFTGEATYMVVYSPDVASGAVAGRVSATDQSKREWAFTLGQGQTKGQVGNGTNVDQLALPTPTAPLIVQILTVEGREGKLYVNSSETFETLSLDPAQLAAGILKVGSA